jgi:hypothetical protein
MATNTALLEAVGRLNSKEDEYRKAREEVANLLKEAVKTNQVTNLARMTGINRTTIYWLIHTWSTDNENRSA